MKISTHPLEHRVSNSSTHKGHYCAEGEVQVGARNTVDGFPTKRSTDSFGDRFTAMDSQSHPAELYQFCNFEL